jgi:hypothetical protein
MRTLEDQESPQVFRDEVLSKEGAEEASTLMRRPVQQQTGTQSHPPAWGWDAINI